jgi:hypothetical protein
LRELLKVLEMVERIGNLDREIGGFGVLLNSFDIMFFIS